MEDVLAFPAPLSCRLVGRQRQVSWPAASVSAALHVVALAAVCLGMLPRRAPPAPPPQSFAMVMAPPAPVAVAEQALEGTRLQPAPAAPASVLSAPLPLSLAPHAFAELHAGRKPARARLQPAPVVDEHAAVAAAKPAAPAGTPRPAGAPAPVPLPALVALEARIRQAVQDAAIYPPSARAMHLEGRTQVRFDYTDGSVGPTDIAISSNAGMLDRAALAAVRRAALPRAPADIGARTLALLVWVDFRLVRQD